MKKLYALALALLLILGTLLTGCGPKGNAEQSGDNAGIKPDPDQEVITTPEAVEESVTVPVSKLLEYAQSSSAIWEFVQRFFSDRIIYKDRLGNYTYVYVDENMPKSDYDFDNLVNVGTSRKVFEYQENGVTTSLKGIDVSQYQGDIDWEKVAADGVKFVFIRAGYRGYGTGKLVQDKCFEQNIQGALKNDIAVGIYFVTQAISIEEALEEADYVLDMIRPYKVSWPIVLDIEDASGKARTADLTASERTEYTLAFCSRILEAGFTPMLYCNIRWFVEELDLTKLTQVDKWFAQYFNRPFFPYEFGVWQYSSTGRIEGINGDVDLNIAFKDYGAGVN